MKKVLFTWFVLTLICVSFSVVDAEEPTERKIYVTGKADIMVAPDILILPIVVNSINDNLDIARKMNKKTVNRVIELSGEIGISDEDIQTSHFSIGKNYITENKKKVHKGYFVETTMAIELHEIENFEVLLPILTKLQDVALNNTIFKTSNEIEIRNKARIDALKSARIKADTMARTLGANLGKPITIREHQPSYRPSVSNIISYDRRSAAEIEGGSHLAVGQIVISAQVDVVFELVD